MQMPSQVTSMLNPTAVSVSALHQWPRPLKKAILIAAVIFCMAVYALLLVGAVGMLALGLNALAG